MSDENLVPREGSDSLPAETSAGVPARVPQASTVPQRQMAKERLASERVIINAPMSFAGAAQRAWRVGGDLTGVPRVAVVAVLIIPLLLLWWVVIVFWYLLFGLLLLPYRLLRRGARKRKAEALRHREMLGALDSMRGDKEEK